MNDAEVAIIEEDGKKFGCMYWKGLEVKEEICPIVFEMTEQRQKYWFRRNLVVLERRMKALRREFPNGRSFEELEAK